jgi:hypothetical protein
MTGRDMIATVSKEKAAASAKLAAAGEVLGMAKDAPSQPGCAAHALLLRQSALAVECVPHQLAMIESIADYLGNGGLKDEIADAATKRNGALREDIIAAVNAKTKSITVTIPKLGPVTLSGYRTADIMRVVFMALLAWQMLAWGGCVPGPGKRALEIFKAIQSGEIVQASANGGGPKP